MGMPRGAYKGPCAQAPHRGTAPLLGHMSSTGEANMV